MASITGFRGDTFNIGFSVTTGSPGAPVDLSGASVYFTMKERLGDSDANATVKKRTPTVSGVTITSSGEGTISVNLPTGESYNFKTGPYYYGLQVKTVDNSVYTTTTGRLHVKAAVGLQADVIPTTG